MKELEEMTLSELKKLGNAKILEQYFIIVNQLKSNKMGKRIVKEEEDRAIEEIYNELTSYEEKIRSHSLFPGDLILLYPSIKEKKSKSLKTCDFSGGIIYP